jgi:hypothetical protein
MVGKDWVGGAPPPLDKRRKSSREPSKKLKPYKKSDLVVKHEAPKAAENTHPIDNADTSMANIEPENIENKPESETFAPVADDNNPIIIARKVKKPKKKMRKPKYPMDIVRHNPEVAEQKRIRLMLFKATTDCSLMERERFDYLTHLNLRSRINTGPKFASKDLNVMRKAKMNSRTVLETRIWQRKDVNDKDVINLRAKRSQYPHVRYKICPCFTLLDIPPFPISKLPRLVTPTFQ